MNPKLFLIYETNRTLMVHFQGFINDKDLLDHSLETIEILKAKGLSKLVVNIEKLGKQTNVCEIWLKKKVFNKSIESGMKHLGLVVLNNHFTKEQIKNMMKKVEEYDLNLQLFSSEKEGINWINTIS